ncbi:MAG: nitroreductase family protein [Anaerolineae bacterium]|nr:nitroreductase family protein [Anaerolineae bacterium]
MLEDRSVRELVEQRYSCRSYAGTPIPGETRDALSAFMVTHATGPFGATVRLALIAATEDDQAALQGLGTYGFIRGATGYVVGAVEATRSMALEDFGYVVEQVVLYATSLGLGTVWLGGTFTRSRFARAMRLQAGESLPAVVATGVIADRPRGLDTLIRRGAMADRRLTWDRLFFEGKLGVPLTREVAGAYGEVLEMVRQGPSASNKQPWRVLKADGIWRLYLERSRRYRRRNAIVGVADMQRIDMGIAMCHWALTAEELGLSGRWVREDLPERVVDGSQALYIASWLP